MSEPRGDVRPPIIMSDERTTLLGFLRYLREAVAAKLDGLTEEQARVSGVESGISPLWLLKHLRITELDWLVWAYQGKEPNEPDSAGPLHDTDTIASLTAAYRESARRCDAVIEACTDLSAPGVRTVREDNNAPSMRWILVHLIEETARHAGHLDILREQLDGATGR